MPREPTNTLPTVTHIVSGDIWAGAEVQAFQLCQSLKHSGKVRPTAIVFNEGTLYERLKKAGIDVSLIDESVLSPLAMIHGIRNHIQTQGTSILHTHGFKENILGVSAGILAGVHCSVRTAHGSPETRAAWYRLDKRLLNILDNLTARFFQDAIIAVSGQLSNTLTQKFGDKVHHIPNFIDVDQLRRDYLDRRSVEHESAKPLIVGIVGRLVPVKRVDLFVDTIAELIHKHQIDVHGMIIGDGPLRSAIEQRVQQKGLESNITITGFQNPVYPALTKLDILLMTSDHEGLPMTLLEALALEVPVVAHNVGGIPEVLNQGSAGVLVNDHSPRGFASAVMSLNSEKKRNSLGTAGRQHVEKTFDWRVNTAKYLNLYGSLVPVSSFE